MKEEKRKKLRVNEIGPHLKLNLTKSTELFHKPKPIKSNPYRPKHADAHGHGHTQGLSISLAAHTIYICNPLIIYQSLSLSPPTPNQKPRVSSLFLSLLNHDRKSEAKEAHSEGDRSKS